MVQLGNMLTPTGKKKKSPMNSFPTVNGRRVSLKTPKRYSGWSSELKIAQYLVTLICFLFKF